MSVKKIGISKKRMIGAFASSIISISLVLILVGIATLLLSNTRKVSDFFMESLQMTIFLTQDATDTQGAEVLPLVQKLPFVKSARLIVQEEGAKDLQDMLGEDFLEVFESSPVPVSIDINLKAEYVQKDSLEMIKAKLSENPLIEGVECRQALLEELSSNMNKIYIALTALTVLLLFISFVLINNVVRLSLLSKRFTVHVMQLVGASRGFIRRPFMWQAAAQGFGSSIIAIVALWGMLSFVHKSVPQMFRIITPETVATMVSAVVGFGLLLCLIVTFIVINKLLGLSKEELYG